MSRVWCK